jgi:hypothetical protein
MFYSNVATFGDQSVNTRLPAIQQYNDVFHRLKDTQRFRDLYFPNFWKINRHLYQIARFPTAVMKSTDCGSTLGLYLQFAQCWVKLCQTYSATGREFSTQSSLRLNIYYTTKKPISSSLTELLHIAARFVVLLFNLRTCNCYGNISASVRRIYAQS